MNSCIYVWMHVQEVQNKASFLLSCVFTHVSMSACTYLWMQTCIYVCIPIHMCTYNALIFTYVCMHACIPVFVYACMYVCMYSRVPVHKPGSNAAAVLSFSLAHLEVVKWSRCVFVCVCKKSKPVACTRISFTSLVSFRFTIFLHKKTRSAFHIIFGASFLQTTENITSKEKESCD